MQKLVIKFKNILKEDTFPFTFFRINLFFYLKKKGHNARSLLKFVLKQLQKH